MASKKLSVFLMVVFMTWSYSLRAQNGKHPAINLSGQIFDEYGNVLGWISKEGIVQNAIDDRIAILDKDGNAMDGRGQRIGKMSKNGTFHDAQGFLVFTVAEQKGQQCELIDPQGKIIGVVHAHFKNQASAIHCLYSKMKVY